MDFSLLQPSNLDIKYTTLPNQAINDLSIDFICNELSTKTFEKNSIKNLMINITDDERVIQYRLDIFDDLQHRRVFLVVKEKGYKSESRFSFYPFCR